MNSIIYIRNKNIEVLGEVFSYGNGGFIDIDIADHSKVYVLSNDKPSYGIVTYC